MTLPWEGPVVPPLTPNTCSACAVQAVSHPPNLSQGDVGNCYLISVLNRIATTENGRRHLASLVRPVGDGYYEVTFKPIKEHRQNPEPAVVEWDPKHTVPVTVIVAEPGGGASGDQVMRVIEKAAAVLYGDIEDQNEMRSEEEIYTMSASTFGSWPSGAMDLLGLEDVRVMSARALASDIATNPDADMIYVLGTRAPAEAADLLTEYKLVGPHAYELVGTYTERATGEQMAILWNPWGNNINAPGRTSEGVITVPVSMLDELFSAGWRGSIPKPRGARDGALPPPGE